MTKNEKLVLMANNCHSMVHYGKFFSSLPWLPIPLGFSQNFHIHAKSKIDKKKV